MRKALSFHGLRTETRAFDRNASNAAADHSFIRERIRFRMIALSFRRVFTLRCARARDECVQPARRDCTFIGREWNRVFGREREREREKERGGRKSIVHRIYDVINPNRVTSGKNYSFISVADS